MSTWPNLRDDDGGAVLEVALVMPVFLLLVVGAIQCAVVLFGYCTASFAARNGARYASVHSAASLNPATAASVQQVVTPWLGFGSKVGVPVVSVAWASGNGVGDSVKVTVTQTYSVVLPFALKTQMSMVSVASRTIVR